MPNSSSIFRGAAAAVAVAVLTLALLVPAPPAFAASVSVSPTSGVDPGGQTITVRGSGFDPDRNNGFGVYVVFGPRRADWTTNANAYQAATWVHRGASAGAGQAPMTASGGFSVGLSVKARYTDGDGRKVDCLTTRCYVITMAAHGVPDRGQDTVTPITFRGSKAGGGQGVGGSSGSSGAKKGDGGSSPASTPKPGAPSASSSGSLAAGAAPREGAAVDASPAAGVERTVRGGRATPAWPFLATTGAALIAVIAARRWGRRRAARRGAP
ncbi:IPT/TIG domain-containing protein [Actinomadura madurae]|uniref:IPT/TIG domain-containing protein n=1 Tax=Actinomadura madurae TaxID=1993 RepID=UPI000D977B97|nr:IPT/TIG domain-containing protein [Actinomadura madurae]SPT51566.1 Uncharacterised protein [Actinomadura madurae]